MAIKRKQPHGLRNWAIGSFAAAVLFVGGGWEERRELLKSQAADTRLVTAILVYQCEDLKGLIMVPEHGAPIFHSSSEQIPLQFYRDEVLRSKNEVLKLTIPCPTKKETIAKAY